MFLLVAGAAVSRMGPGLSIANAMEDDMELNMPPPLVYACIVLLKQTIKLITLN